jgi:ankyrin repeat protein
VLFSIWITTSTSDVERFPLAKYAAQYWVEHARFEDVASRVMDGIEILFDPDNPYFAAWIGLYDMDRPGYARLSDLSLPKPNPLYYSVLCGFYDLVKHLAIKYPQNVNAIYGRYRFPLFAAVKEGHIEVAELLLEHGANINARETTGKTILLTVLSAGIPRPRNTLQGPRNLVTHERQLEVAQMLVKRNADINSQDDFGKTPLHYLSCSWIDDEDGVLNLALLLLKRGAEVNIRDQDNQTPLHLSVRHRYKLVVILLEHGADANTQDNNARTTLHRLLSERRYDDEGDVINLALLLLKHGAEVNTRDWNDQTPLHLAIGRDWFKLAGILLEHGADTNAEDDGGKTPFYILLDSQIHDTSGFGYVLKHKRSWVAHSAEVNRRYKDKETSLLNVDASVENITNEIPAHQVLRGQYDTRGRRVGVSQLLPEHGMGTTSVPTHDEDHLTPSHLPSNIGPVQIAQALLDHDANANGEGETSFYQDFEGEYHSARYYSAALTRAWRRCSPVPGALGIVVWEVRYLTKAAR